MSLGTGAVIGMFNLYLLYGKTSNVDNTIIPR